MIPSEIDFAPNAMKTSPVALVIQRPYRRKMLRVIGRPVQRTTQAVATRKPQNAEATSGSTFESDMASSKRENTAVNIAKAKG